MAESTNPNLSKQMIYSVFVRNHSREGTFAKVEEDLDRIRDLGTDILWLMPIHPTGKVERKGEDGSPYAIADYWKIDPKMGTEEDLKHLVQSAHEKGMEVILDIVFNHTSPDSKMVQEHPEWFYRDEDGKPYPMFREWSDIVDLDFSSKALQEELIRILKHYASIVDGFRCDVASRVPVSFWKKARAACDTVKPDLFWLAESCHLPFIKFCRDNGRVGESDSALYEAFDVLYDYDAFPYCEKIFEDGKPMEEWVDALIRQDAELPQNAIKLRYLENHDTDRISQYVKDWPLWKNWTALQFTLKGMPLVYHGQEIRTSHRPDIFTADPIAWKEDDAAADWIRTLAHLHKTLFSAQPVIDYEIDETHPVLRISRDGYAGAFLLAKTEPDALISTNLKDGVWYNLFTGTDFEVADHHMKAADFPVLVQMEDEVKD